MPRRTKADRFSRAVGRRIRELRQEAGLTMEKLSWEIENGSKGHISSLERGLVNPTTQLLKGIADALGVLPLDLLTFPDQDERQALVDSMRKVSPRELAQLSKTIRLVPERRKA